MNDASNRLNDVLKHTGLTRNSLAKEIGLKRSQNLYDIENGKVKNISFELASLINQKFKKINKDWLLTGEGEMLNETYQPIIQNMIAEPGSEYKISLVRSASVPIYDVEFAAGVMISLIESREEHYPIGYLNIPEVNGCDAIIRAKGDSMAKRINDRDWIGIKRLNKNEWFPMGYIYAIETEQAQIIKYIKKGNSEDFYKIVSHNEFYEDEEIPKSVIKEIWSVRAVLPFSNIETLI